MRHCILVFLKNSSQAIYISFLEPGDDYKFTYSIWLNPGVMNAADAQEVSCHNLCGLIDRSTVSPHRLRKEEKSDG